MIKYLIAIVSPLVFSVGVSAQSLESLRIQMNQIIASKKAVVGFDIIGTKPADTLSFNGEKHLPMQSVFKFHIAIVVLSEIDKGRYSLDQKVKIEEHELLPNLYSPLREEHPKGATLTIGEILGYTVSKSDNVGCDVLLKLLGGPKVVEKYFADLGFSDLSIKINEETMQANWDLQFQNWTTAKSANRVLKAFYENDKKLLSPHSHQFLWDLMKQTSTGSNRIKGQLPKGTVVAHKTGWSGSNKEGITAAVNNIGIVFLPNGEHFYISVFVSNSTENLETNEEIIASLAKIVWDYYTKN